MQGVPQNKHLLSLASCKRGKLFGWKAVDCIPVGNLVDQIDWMSIVLKWKQRERNGLDVKTLSELFK